MALFSFANKSVVITGGGSGLGRAIAKAFVEQGARVLISGRREAKLKEVQAELGSACFIEAGDISVEADARALGDRAKAEFDGLDVWVNNAGVLERGTLPEADLAHLEKTLKINVEGVFLGCREAVRLFGEGPGAIVNVSSYLSTHAGASGTLPAYCASKGAVSAMTRSLAVFHGPQQIRVNAVCPALVRTELNDDIWEGKDEAEFNRELGERYPLRRIGHPKDVAAATLYLASDEAAWVTGQELYVDGGISVV